MTTDQQPLDPEAVYATMTAVAAGEVGTYRNLEAKSVLEESKRLIDAPWSRRTKYGLAERPAALQAAYDMRPETPVTGSTAD